MQKYILRTIFTECKRRQWHHFLITSCEQVNFTQQHSKCKKIIFVGLMYPAKFSTVGFCRKSLLLIHTVTHIYNRPSVQIHLQLLEFNCQHLKEYSKMENQHSFFFHCNYALIGHWVLNHIHTIHTHSHTIYTAYMQYSICIFKTQTVNWYRCNPIHLMVIYIQMKHVFHYGWLQVETDILTQAVLIPCFTMSYCIYLLRENKMGYIHTWSSPVCKVVTHNAVRWMRGSR